MMDEHAQARRRFLEDFSRRALGMCGVACLLAPGCTLPVRSHRARSGPTASVPLAAFPELRQPGGRVKVFVGDRGAVYVRCEGGEEYTAVSAVCTHLGCLINPSGEGFSCPCHGSTFDREGRNTGGPARRPLPRFRAALGEGPDGSPAVTIDLEKGAS